MSPEKVRAVMTQVEGDSIAGKQPEHQGGQRLSGWLQQQVSMIVEQRPGVTAGLGFNQQRTQPPDEIFPVVIIQEDIASRDPAKEDVLEQSGIIDTGLTWHRDRIYVK